MVTHVRKRTLTATAYDATTESISVLLSPGTLLWSSSNSTFVRIDSAGVATGGLPGPATITALETESGVSGAATVTTTAFAIYFSDSLNNRIVSVDDMTGSGQRNTSIFLRTPYGVAVDGQ